MKRKLKFVVDGVVGGEVVYEAGKSYEIEDELGSANRWLTRNFAYEIEELEEIVCPAVVKEEILEIPEQVLGYDPGHQEPSIVDVVAGEEFDIGLDALGEEAVVLEEVVIVEVAKVEVVVENKKERKSNKGK